MIYTTSIDYILQYTIDLYTKIKRNPLLILVGGCSRSGKTTLVSELSEKLLSIGIKTKNLILDAWLVSVDKRKNNSTVIERYEVMEIIESVKKILNRKIIYPPVYDVITRRRFSKKSNVPIRINDGILFIDGVIALAINELRDLASLKLFIDIPDEIRIKRLKDFYYNTKQLSKEETKHIIKKRELEEVPFIRRTAKNADIIFNRYI